MQPAFDLLYDNLALRREIDELRSTLESLECKTPDQQEILLEPLNSAGAPASDGRKFARLLVKSGARNALSGRMISKLTECLYQLYEEDAHCCGLLIQGHGGTFCSGSDLVSVRRTASQQGGWKLARVMQFNLMLLQQLPFPTFAFVEGYALGGGAELAMGADMRLMAGSAQVGFVHIKVGVCCGWGGASRLLELVGPARALDLLTSGRLVGAAEALSLGLTNGIADNMEQVLDFMTSHTRPIGQLAPMRALKSMVNAARASGAPNAPLRPEASWFASTWGQTAHLRALDGNIKHNSNCRDNNNSPNTAGQREQ